MYDAILDAANSFIGWSAVVQQNALEALESMLLAPINHSKRLRASLFVEPVSSMRYNPSQRDLESQRILGDRALEGVVKA